MGWNKDIATAPRNNLQILVYCPALSHHPFIAACFGDEWLSPETSDRYQFEGPTWWTGIPLPPSA